MSIHNKSFIYLPSETAVYVNAACSAVIMLIAIIGNLFMVTIFVRFKDLRDLNNTAITFLSLSDLLRASIVMTMKIYHQLEFIQTPYEKQQMSEPMCKISAFVCGFTFVFSPMVLALIGAVRYCKIVPWTKRSLKFNKRRFYICVIVVFLFATSFALLPIIVPAVGRYQYSPSHGVCFTDWGQENEIFRTLFYVIVIGMSFPVLTVCYVGLFKSLRQHNKRIVEQRTKERGESLASTVSGGSTGMIISNITNMEGTEKPNGDSKNSKKSGVTPIPCINCVRRNEINIDSAHKGIAVISHDNGDIGRTKKANKFVKGSTCSLKERFMTTIRRKSRCEAEPMNQHICRQEFQVTRILMIIFMAYILCWFPAAILNFLKLFDKEIDCICNLLYFYVIVTLIELKCALNPVIYGIGNQKYRNAIKDTVRRVKMWRS